ncbi:MAG: hypothetical protein PF541_15045, partial [Prolixibacteraceae bacterium]|nr:hypothetical protein [Prolixibacteraceae bacterium]
MNSNKKILSVLLFVSLLIISSCSKNEIESYQIQKGKFVQTITETGELAAINVKAFVMPRFGQYWYQMKIIGLLDHGDIVQPGDSVIQFDPTKIKKFIIEKENELETQKANLEKILVQIENRKSELRSSLRSEQASFDLKKLEMEQFRFESDKIKSLKELEFKQAELRLNKVKRSIELYETISQNQLKIQQINVKRRSEEIKNAYDVLPQLTVRTPIPGIFQIARKRRSHELLKIGDEVYVGNRLGNVPDLTWMKVNTIVNEADFLKIKEGQKVNVRL